MRKFKFPYHIKERWGASMHRIENQVQDKVGREREMSVRDNLPTATIFLGQF